MSGRARDTDQRGARCEQGAGKLTERADSDAGEERINRRYVILNSVPALRDSATDPLPSHPELRKELARNDALKGLNIVLLRSQLDQGIAAIQHTCTWRQPCRHGLLTWLYY